MTRVEQRKLITDLQAHIRKMSGKEQAAFEMMVKRDRDDEDLDELTRRTLLELHKKYVPVHSKQQLDKLWDNMTSGKKS